MTSETMMALALAYLSIIICNQARGDGRESVSFLWFLTFIGWSAYSIYLAVTA